MERQLIDPVTAPDQIGSALAGLMTVESYMVRPDGAMVVEGSLLQDSRSIFRPLRQRIEAIGFTPFLRRHHDRVQLLAVPGVIHRPPQRVWINVALFLATVVTVLLTGALNEPPHSLGSLGDLARGVPFTLTLLGILGAHEMGHFVVGRIRGAPVSWPYFIPMPPGISITGTMGAVIVQREPLEDRRTLLEVGIAGPLAGLVVAIPLLFAGLSASPVGPTPNIPYLQEGNSLLYAAIKWLVFGRFLPSGGMDVSLNSVAFGAWIGLLVTMLNLLPVGQLDGGHVAYALLGRRADYLAFGVLGVCVAMGITFSYTWLIWGAMALLTGIRHPAPFNDVPSLGSAHMVLALSGLLLFVLLLMPVPLMPVNP